MTYYPRGLGLSTGDALVANAGLWLSGSVYYVDSVNGSDGWAGTSQSFPKKTLASALTASSDGDMIVLLPGHNGEVTSGLSIPGQSRIIVGGATADGLPTCVIDPGTGAGWDGPTVTVTHVFRTLKFGQSAAYFMPQNNVGHLMAFRDVVFAGGTYPIIKTDEVSALVFERCHFLAESANSKSPIFASAPVTDAPIIWMDGCVWDSNGNAWNDTVGDFAATAFENFRNVAVLNASLLRDSRLDRREPTSTDEDLFFHIVTSTGGSGVDVNVGAAVTLTALSGGTGASAGGELLTDGEILTSGSIWYVHAGTGEDSASGGKSREEPLATLGQAVTNAGHSDLIVLMDGHKEVVTSKIDSNRNLFIVAELANDGSRSVEITDGVIADDMMDVGGSGFLHLVNITFKAPTTPKGAGATVFTLSTPTFYKNCRFEVTENVDTEAMVGQFSGQMFMENVEAVYTGDENGGKAAVEFSGQYCQFVGCTFSAGDFGFEDYAFKATSVYGFVVIDTLTLSGGADIHLVSTVKGAIQADCSGGSRVVWEVS